jgi:hypothetical protein
LLDELSELICSLFSIDVGVISYFDNAFHFSFLGFQIGAKFDIDLLEYFPFASELVDFATEFVIARYRVVVAQIAFIQSKFQIADFL